MRLCRLLCWRMVRSGHPSCHLTLCRGRERLLPQGGAESSRQDTGDGHGRRGGRPPWPKRKGPVAGSRPGLLSPGLLAAHPVELTDTGSCAGRVDGALGAAEGAGRPPGAHHIGVEQSPGQGRRHQRHHLVARFARPGASPRSRRCRTSSGRPRCRARVGQPVHQGRTVFIAAVFLLQGHPMTPSFGGFGLRREMANLADRVNVVAGRGGKRVSA